MVHVLEDARLTLNASLWLDVSGMAGLIEELLWCSRHQACIYGCMSDAACGIHVSAHCSHHCHICGEQDLVGLICGTYSLLTRCLLLGSVEWWVALFSKSTIEAF